MFYRLLRISGLLLMTTPSLSHAADTGPDGNLVVTDFSANSADLGWYVLNDNIMGGRSEGDFDIEQERLVFAGRTNTRGGGFSSIRTAELRLDLSGHDGIRLRVMGDGRRYTWRLTTNARWRGRQVAYWADFDTVDGEWTTADIPYDRFVPRFRGYQLEGPALDPSRITGMGLMIYDNQDGPFRLQLDSVHAYAPSTKE
jgi:monofunctional biosynthetic peptidoglycan transglycosylase